MTIVWVRFAMGVVTLGIAVAARKQFALLNKHEWHYFALLGFLGITFHQWLQSNALQTSEASTTAWIVATTPVVMAMLGWMKVLGILLAFTGELLVVYDGNLSAITGEIASSGKVPSSQRHIFN